MSYLGTVPKNSFLFFSWIASEDIPVTIRYTIITIDAGKPCISSIIQITEQQKLNLKFGILPKRYYSTFFLKDILFT